MKKSLIALAALAATGTAFSMGHSGGSSVTLSGKLGYSYAKGSPTSHGNFGFTDGDLRFVAVEDMGGGMRAVADMEIRVRGRGNSDAGSLPSGATSGSVNSGIGARNATISLMGGFGSLTLGAIEAANAIKPIGWAGAPIGIAYALEGRNNGGPLDSASNLDAVIYTTPDLVKGLKARYLRVENVSEVGGGPTANDPGPGVRTGAGVRAHVYGANYTQGPIRADIDYTAFSSGNASSGDAYDGVRRTRMSASYNFGMVSAGFGWTGFSGTKGALAGRKSNYTWGVSATVSPVVKLGLVYAKDNKPSNASQTDNGYAVGMDYSLSKRTVFNASYINQKESTTASRNGSMYQFRVMHSF